MDRRRLLSSVLAALGAALMPWKRRAPPIDEEATFEAMQRMYEVALRLEFDPPTTPLTYMGVPVRYARSMEGGVALFWDGRDGLWVDKHGEPWA